jgi:hypothetical protein
MEEINAEIGILGLIGIYTGHSNDHDINFIFAGKIIKGEPVANKDEINDIDWYSADEILHLPDEQILNPDKLKMVIAAHRSGKLISFDCIEEDIYPQES